MDFLPFFAEFHSMFPLPVRGYCYSLSFILSRLPLKVALDRDDKIILYRENGGCLKYEIF